MIFGTFTPHILDTNRKWEVSAQRMRQVRPMLARVESVFAQVRLD